MLCNISLEQKFVLATATEIHDSWRVFPALRKQPLSSCEGTGAGESSEGAKVAWQRDWRSLNPLTLASPRAGATAARSQLHVHPCAALHRHPFFYPRSLRREPSTAIHPGRIQGAHKTRGEPPPRGNITRQHSSFTPAAGRAT